MTKADIQKTIKDLEGGIASPSVPDRFKGGMREQVAKLKSQLAGMEKSAPTPKTKPEAKTTEKSNNKDMQKVADIVSAKELMRNFDKALIEIGDPDDLSIILKDNKTQNDFIKILNQKIPFQKFSDGVFDIIEDNNYHILNQYLAFSGMYGDKLFATYNGNYQKRGSDYYMNPVNFRGSKNRVDDDASASKKKGVPLPKDKQSIDDEYDCDELYEKEKQRRAKAKERASKPKKTDATKNKEKLEKVFENVKERAMEEDVSKSELEKLISSTEALLKMLKDKLAKMK